MREGHTDGRGKSGRKWEWRYAVKQADIWMGGVMRATDT